MAKHLALLISIIFILYSCKTVNPPINQYQPLNTFIYVDVVKKKIIQDGIYKGEYSNKTNKEIIKWLKNNVKTNGFEGYTEIRLLDIVTSENNTPKSFLINIFVKIELSIFKSALDRKKTIIIEGDEYGEINGSYTINDKSIEVENTIKRLIEKFTINLVKKIN